ncbi:Uncharacterised protein [Mycobacteroides abscessus subsp. abscessus]|nr:Uncharacterised protein [Mycobacteroides abscessus subsp. abscessus]
MVHIVFNLTFSFSRWCRRNDSKFSFFTIISLFTIRQKDFILTNFTLITHIMVVVRHLATINHINN